MLSLPQAAAAIALNFVPGYLRLGRLHLPVYGVFAALGLIAALWLSQRAAAAVGLSPDKLWDAGMSAVIAAFVASRLLLVVFDLRAFLHFPLLVLALPSLTYAGMLLTGVAVWWYLRWKGLPWRDVADAWAPCAALLAAVLSIGHFIEGTEAGMPTSMRWGLVTSGDTVLGKVHPVQLYEAALALAMCVVLLRWLPKRKFAGQVAAVAMIVGGVLAFLLDMLRQPVETGGEAWLDPGQFIALASIAAGTFVYRIGSVERRRAVSLSRLQAAKLIEDFIAGSGGKWDWDGFISEHFDDPLLSWVQAHCLVLPEEHPPAATGGWCNETGIEIMHTYARTLRSEATKLDRGKS